jgi:membrane-associated phospholipid phosphatase
MNYLNYAYRLYVSLCNPVTFALLVLLFVSLLRKNQLQRRDDFITAIGYAGFCGISVQLHNFLIWFRPNTIDASLLRIDHAIGLDPVRFYSWIFEQHHLLFSALQSVYNFLAYAIVILWLLERNHTLRRALLIGGIGVWFFYALFPAAGPVYYANGLTATALRNCLPSMHFAWALLLPLNSRSWLRAPLWVYAGLMALATVAIGQHYVIDLIVAIPYTFVVQRIACYLQDREFGNSTSNPEFAILRRPLAGRAQ